MKSAKTAIIASIILLSLASCSGIKSNPLFDNAPLASLCTIETEKTQVVVRDYFPLFSSQDTLDLSMEVNTPLLSLLEIYDGDQMGSLVVRNALPEKVAALDRSKAPRLSTRPVGGSDNSFALVMEGGVDMAVVLWQNTVLERGKGIDVVDSTTLIVTVPRQARKMERSYIRAFAANEAGGVGNDVLVPVEYGKIISDASQLKRTDKHAQILYSLMIDRFVNGNPSNDMPLNSPLVNHKVDYWGGDIAGVTKTVRSGYFDRLGVNTIWLSPVTQNPFDAWGQIHDPETKFSGYHGYWPYFATAVDVRYGTDDELRELLSEAHGDNMNVILDYVSNHMHIQSPTLTEHPDWTTPSDTPDGRPNRQLYDEFRLTTWFDDHIPTLDLEREDICEQLTDSALFWVLKFDFDGYRHDATKHIPEGYWRLLTRKILENVDRPIYQIGETYGSPSLINLYVKPGMQDGQFDFNIYDTFVWATTRPEGSFEGLSNCISDSQSTYGSHNLMGIITGNHDRTRYICLASGDVSQDEDQKLAGWHRDIRVTNPAGYRYLKMLHAMNFTLPGVPCIYYGDEFGQPGANDPDNRRWMQFDDLSSDEQDVLDTVCSLAHLRRGSMALNYGDYIPLVAQDDVFVYLRSYMGNFVLTALNKGDSPYSAQIDLPFGLKIDGQGSVRVEVAPVSYQIINN